MDTPWLLTHLEVDLLVGNYWLPWQQKEVSETHPKEGL